MSPKIHLVLQPYSLGRGRVPQTSRCRIARQNIGILIFEFSRVYTSDYAKGTDFVADLNKFFNNLPAGWPYGIEIRNRHWLAPEYFACLARHRVTHVFNSWDAIATVSEQKALEG